MRVGFFVTCLVDLMRPSIGFAAIELLEAGAQVCTTGRRRAVANPAYNWAIGRR
jgi:L-lactate dehydrogenase complex protein LldE